MSFHVGQKVVCVDAEMAPMLRHGAIYTIRGIDTQECYAGRIGLHLEEVTPNDDGDDWWVAFRSSRFRPIQERKTDIGFAHEILKKVTRKQTERA